MKPKLPPLRSSGAPISDSEALYFSNFTTEKRAKAIELTVARNLSYVQASPYLGVGPQRVRELLRYGLWDGQRRLEYIANQGDDVFDPFEVRLIFNESIRVNIQIKDAEKEVAAAKGKLHALKRLLKKHPKL